MSVAVKNEPYRQGAPGRTLCAIATPLRASATWIASAPATLTGEVAPASRNGVITVGWFSPAVFTSASAIRVSQIRGEFGLMITIVTAASLAASSPPWAIRAIAIASRDFGPLVPYAVKGLSLHRSTE